MSPFQKLSPPPNRSRLQGGVPHDAYRVDEKEFVGVKTKPQ